MTQCPNHNNLMEKIDTIIQGQADLRVEIAGLPEKILEKTDTKYASKETEQAVKRLVDRAEVRTYDWVKYILTALISASIATFINKQ